MFGSCIHVSSISLHAKAAVDTRVQHSKFVLFAGTATAEKGFELLRAANHKVSEPTTVKASSGLAVSLFATPGSFSGAVLSFCPGFRFVCLVRFVSFFVIFVSWSSGAVFSFCPGFRFVECGYRHQ